MKIPKKVKLGGYTYSVKYKKGLEIDGDKCMGCIQLTDQNILIDPDYSQQTQEKAFIHELVHAIAYTHGVKWGSKDEEFTDKVANGIHALINQNKGMFT